MAYASTVVLMPAVLDVSDVGTRAVPSACRSWNARYLRPSAVRFTGRGSAASNVRRLGDALHSQEAVTVMERHCVKGNLVKDVAEGPVGEDGQLSSRHTRRVRAAFSGVRAGRTLKGMRRGMVRTRNADAKGVSLLSNKKDGYSPELYSLIATGIVPGTCARI